MNTLISSIPDRILFLAKGALAQANMHAAFYDPGNEHWDFISILNAAHAGELFIKAIIAKEHPLLIFKDLFFIDDKQVVNLDIATLIKRGKTHDFEKLPQVLWVTTGKRIPNPDCYERLRVARNAIQHFCAPESQDFRATALEFLYTIVDPIINDVFGYYAIDYHEDHDIGYDYLVSTLLRSELRFSIPDDFSLTEVDAARELHGAEVEYRKWFSDQMKRVGRSDLFCVSTE